MLLKNRTLPGSSIAAMTVALIAFAIVMSGPSFGQNAPILITGPINESNLVTLEGNTRPEANTFNDRGRVPDSFPLEHMLLQLKRPPALEQALDQYIEQLTDKASPNFRHWITPDQLGEQYGMSQQDLSAIQAWLRSHGFTVGVSYPNRMVIDFSG